MELQAINKIRLRPDKNTPYQLINFGLKLPDN